MVASPEFSTTKEAFSFFNLAASFSANTLSEFRFTMCISLTSGVLKGNRSDLPPERSVVNLKKRLCFSGPVRRVGSPSGTTKRERLTRWGGGCGGGGGGGGGSGSGGGGGDDVSMGPDGGGEGMSNVSVASTTNEGCRGRGGV